jgi:2,3-bisphosphoglycerate-independent phosphoglycerate mutase
MIKGIEHTMSEHGVGRIASVSGRFYAMDRNNNWDRTEKAYKVMVDGKGNEASSAILAIEKSYKKKVYDEEFLPTVIKKNGRSIGKIKNDDAVVFFNFRPDRARQLTKAFVIPDFKEFERDQLKNLFFATFMVYEKGLPVKIVFPPYVIKETLGEILAKNGLKQLRIAETEKYAHVTYFFNGGNEEPNEGEDRILVPSPSVSSYDLRPEMSAIEVTKKLVEAIDSDKYDFILVNYANADMVGHTSNLQAAIKAIEAVDKCVAKVIRSVLLRNGLALVTADHGNAEVMFNMQTGQKDKEHTSNYVPFILVGVAAGASLYVSGFIPVPLL